MIEKGVLTQTKIKPVSCLPSHYGVNPKTGKITWIVSFLTPVKGFSLFNASERDARGSATHQSVCDWQDTPTAVSPQASMRGQQARSARERQDVPTAANPTQLGISTALPHPGA
ncbi:predicted protein [Histoplasma mississippiense (nom. inval.)]|uniref:predicted protein n=1 Tax=Ajellomyces capsulatus (strain NAm1 / WU24) TaxID=2059318 RepID=UPI000157C869|nr:predicted protein [Histoplasma mississippiense (nom. inval.)]EDN09859.1 predicted protein [Histoplasma mississippiense (nom. inval.)]